MDKGQERKRKLEDSIQRYSLLRDAHELESWINDKVILEIVANLRYWRIRWQFFLINLVICTKNWQLSYKKYQWPDLKSKCISYFQEAIVTSEEIGKDYEHVEAQQKKFDDFEKVLC